MMTQDDLLQAFIDLTAEKGQLPDSSELHVFYSRVQVPEEIQFLETIDLAVYFLNQVLDVYHLSKKESGLSNEMSFGESFSFLVYTSTDLFEQHRFFSIQCLELVSTGWFYPSYAKKRLEPEIQQFIQDDKFISSTALLFAGDLFINQLICEWESLILMRLKEEMTTESWTERIDKFSALLDSLLHTDVADKSFDYLKTRFNQEFSSLKSFLSTIF